MVLIRSLQECRYFEDKVPRAYAQVLSRLYLFVFGALNARSPCIGCVLLVGSTRHQCFPKTRTMRPYARQQLALIHELTQATYIQVDLKYLPTHANYRLNPKTSYTAWVSQHSRWVFRYHYRLYAGVILH